MENCWVRRDCQLLYPGGQLGPFFLDHGWGRWAQRWSADERLDPWLHQGAQDCEGSRWDDWLEKVDVEQTSHGPWWRLVSQGGPKHTWPTRGRMPLCFTIQRTANSRGYMGVRDGRSGEETPKKTNLGNDFEKSIQSVESPKEKKMFAVKSKAQPKVTLTPKPECKSELAGTESYEFESSESSFSGFMAVRFESDGNLTVHPDERRTMNKKHRKSVLEGISLLNNHDRVMQSSFGMQPQLSDGTKEVAIITSHPALFQDFFEHTYDVGVNAAYLDGDAGTTNWGDMFEGCKLIVVAIEYKTKEYPLSHGELAYELEQYCDVTGCKYIIIDVAQTERWESFKTPQIPHINEVGLAFVSNDDELIQGFQTWSTFRQMDDVLTWDFCQWIRDWSLDRELEDQMSVAFPAEIVEEAEEYWRKLGRSRRSWRCGSAGSCWGPDSWRDFVGWRWHSWTTWRWSRTSQSLAKVATTCEDCSAQTAHSLWPCPEICDDQLSTCGQGEKGICRCSEVAPLWNLWENIPQEANPQSHSPKWLHIQSYPGDRPFGIDRRDWTEISNPQYGLCWRLFSASRDCEGWSWTSIIAILFGRAHEEMVQLGRTSSRHPVWQRIAQSRCFTTVHGWAQHPSVPCATWEPRILGKDRTPRRFVESPLQACVYWSWGFKQRTGWVVSYTGAMCEERLSTCWWFFTFSVGAWKSSSWSGFDHVRRMTTRTSEPLRPAVIHRRFLQCNIWQGLKPKRRSFTWIVPGEYNVLWLATPVRLTANSMLVTLSHSGVTTREAAHHGRRPREWSDMRIRRTYMAFVR